MSYAEQDYTQDVELFEAMCDKHLGFLVRDYGFALLPDGKEKAIRLFGDVPFHDFREEIGRLYQSENVALRLVVGYYGFTLFPRLYRVRDGIIQYPPLGPAGQYDGPDGIPNCCSPGAVTLYRRPELYVEVYLRRSRAEGTPDRLWHEQTYETQFAGLARYLRECNDDVLRGDFSVAKTIGNLSQEESDKLRKIREKVVFGPLRKARKKNATA